MMMLILWGSQWLDGGGDEFLMKLAMLLAAKRTSHHQPDGEGGVEQRRPTQVV
jgi:hypothetical protein